MTKQISHTYKSSGDAIHDQANPCDFCGISSLSHIHYKGDLPKEFEITEDKKINQSNEYNRGYDDAKQHSKLEDDEIFYTCPICNAKMDRGI